MAAIYSDLKGQVVLITGGGSGIGEAIVRQFAAQHAKVAFIDLAIEPSRALVRELTEAGTPVHFEPCDLTDIPALQRSVAAIRKLLGPIHVLVNNAAHDERHPTEEVTEAIWDSRIAVNLKHQFFCAQAVIPDMKAAGGGAIINLGSISWHLGIKELAVYQTAKAAIEGLTRALAREYGEDNIRVTCVVPGNVRTPRQLKWYTPEGEAEIVAGQALKGRLAPEDIAAMVLSLASDDARLVTGHEYFVDAGWR